MATSRRSAVGAERDWLEIIAVGVLSLAAVATAWSSYQATRWNGETTKASSRANAVRVEAARAADLANAETQVDLAAFVQWVDAHVNDDTELESFYLERFRDEFRPAFDAWLATDPLVNPEAPPTPFVMDEYQLAARTTADRLDAEEDVLSATVRRNVQRAGNYVLAVVLFAVALTFAGMSGRFEGRGARMALLAVSCLVFLGTLAWVVTSPISISL